MATLAAVYDAAKLYCMIPKDVSHTALALANKLVYIVYKLGVYTYFLLQLKSQ